MGRRPMKHIYETTTAIRTHFTKDEVMRLLDEQIPAKHKIPGSPILSIERADDGVILVQTHRSANVIV
jgi:hypothetical protein